MRGGKGQIIQKHKLSELSSNQGRKSCNALVQALKEIRRCLTPQDGTFIMVDPFRRKGETLGI